LRLFVYEKLHYMERAWGWSESILDRGSVDTEEVRAFFISPPSDMASRLFETNKGG
jgi:hypothetical protein